MSVILTLIVVGLGIVAVVSAVNFWTAPQLRRRVRPLSSPKVSVLIPARNEAENIPACLTSLLVQDYENLEIIVCDDASADGTAGIVMRYAALDCRVSLITAGALPPGWTGKNRACHLLSRKATGDILVFTDADTWHREDAISNSVGWLQRHGLGMLSAIPEQRTPTLLEKLVVHSVYYFAFAYLPFWMTHLSKRPSLSAANGQWLVFTREAYDKSGGHAAVKDEVVEDVVLARKAKSAGVRYLVLSGAGVSFCRMYRTPQALWHGFSKNLYGLAGGGTLAGFAATIGIIFSVHLLPYLLLFPQPYRKMALIAVALNVVSRVLVALKFRQAFVASVLLHPVGMLAVLTIAMNSFVANLTDNVRWKGRRLRLRGEKLYDHPVRP